MYVCCNQPATHLSDGVWHRYACSCCRHSEILTKNRQLLVTATGWRSQNSALCPDCDQPVRLRPERSAA
jgi:hypothetical protein